MELKNVSVTNDSITISKEDLTIKSTYNGVTETIDNYSLENNIVTLFYKSRKFEKAIVIAGNSASEPKLSNTPCIIGTANIVPSNSKY